MTTASARSTPAPSGSVGVPELLRALEGIDAGAPPDVEAAALARVLTLAAQGLAARSRAASAWSATVRAQVVGALDEAGRLTSAAKAPLLAAQESSGEWRATGVRRFEDFRATTTRAGKGVARREVEAARTVRELDGGLDALTDGTLTPAHVDLLGAVAGRLPAHQKAALLAGEGATKIKELARRHDATKFASKLEDLAAAMSARDMEDTHQSARARRHLELVPTSDGMTRISGLVDQVAGHTIALALEAANPRPPAEDDRRPGQRSADALVALASAGLADAKATGNARTQVLITMTSETFEQARRYLQSGVDHPDGLASDSPLASAPAPVVRCQDGPLLPLSELARALCDCEIGRLVVGADSLPLDLGRSVRLFTPAQRRAVIARDGGCAWEGCTMPTRYCEVHHLDWWDDDHGSTSVDRAALVCSFHHHELHRRELDLVRDDPLVTSSDAPRIPGNPEYEPPRRRLVPRSVTRADRESRRRARLLDEVRSDSAARKAARSRGSTMTKSGPVLAGAPEAEVMQPEFDVLGIPERAS